MRSSGGRSSRRGRSCRSPRPTPRTAPATWNWPSASTTASWRLREKQIASAAELDAAAAAVQRRPGETEGRRRPRWSRGRPPSRPPNCNCPTRRSGPSGRTAIRTAWSANASWTKARWCSINQPIVSILENNPLTAVVFVIERDYPKMRVGQEALVTTDAYPGPGLHRGHPADRPAAPGELPAGPRRDRDRQSRSRAQARHVRAGPGRVRQPGPGRAGPDQRAGATGRQGRRLRR